MFENLERLSFEFNLPSTYAWQYIQPEHVLIKHYSQAVLAASEVDAILVSLIDAVLEWKVTIQFYKVLKSKMKVLAIYLICGKKNWNTQFWKINSRYFKKCEL